MINVFQPTVGDEEVEAIRAVLESSWLGKGPQVAGFESDLAEYFGVTREQLATTNSCTEAMFQILDYIEQPGGGVVLPTISFVGAANAIVEAGMQIQFADVNPRTGNPTVDNVIEASDDTTVAVLVQHFGGIPCDIRAITEWARSRNILVIEDSAGSIASRVEGKACGTFGDFGVWSFDAMKMVVAGDGGAIFAADPAVMVQLRERMYMGMSAVSGSVQSAANDRWWEFDVSFPGRRSIMNDVAAAMGRTQLRKLSANVERRKRNADLYAQGLRNLSPDVGLPATESAGVHLSHYFYPIRVQREHRDSLAHHLRAHDVYTTFRYYPLHHVGLYGDHNYVLPGAESFAEAALLLPQHASLTDGDVDRIVSHVREYFDG